MVQFLLVANRGCKMSYVTIIHLHCGTAALFYINVTIIFYKTEMYLLLSYSLSSDGVLVESVVLSAYFELCCTPTLSKVSISEYMLRD